MTNLSPVAADADFIGAGDDVVVVADGRRVAAGVLVDVDGDAATVNLGDRWDDFPFAQIAHADSELASSSIG